MHDKYCKITTVLKLALMSDHKNIPLPHLGFQLIKPSTDLARYIQSYWFMQTEHLDAVDTNEYLHPDGGMSIIFNYSDKLQFDDGSSVGDCIFDGVNTSTKSLTLKGKFNTVGIRFLPAGASAFLYVPLNEFKNELISLADTPLKNQSELYHQLPEIPTIEGKVAFIEKWLCRALLPENKLSQLMHASLHLINQFNGSLQISTLTEQLNINPRQLERLFKTQVGITAKEMTRNIRVKYARDFIKQHPERTLVNIAHDLGFYDQAHFNHQFKQVIGISPKVYAAKSQAVSKT